MCALPIQALSSAFDALKPWKGVLASASAGAVRPSAASARSVAVQLVFWPAWSQD
jgi:hypothetical protein